MIDEIHFDQDAIRDLHLAKCFYDSLGRGDMFLNDFENQIYRIKTMPLAFQLRYKSIRIIKFENFPYTIHYTIVGDMAVILNILNQSQDF